MFSQEEREVIYDVIYKSRDARTFLPDPVSPEVIQRVL
jgi:5,6-dimethylbenzimidazole synthase